jgi:hypothetical protein
VKLVLLLFLGQVRERSELLRKGTALAVPQRAEAGESHGFSVVEQTRGKTF